MRKRTLHPFGAPTQECQTARPADASTIRVNQRLRIRHASPALRATVRLGEIGADPEGVQVNQRAVAVVALVGDQFLEAARGACAFQLIGGVHDGVEDAARVADVGTLDGHRDHRAAVGIRAVRIDIPLVCARVVVAPTRPVGPWRRAIGRVADDVSHADDAPPAATL